MRCPYGLLPPTTAVDRSRLRPTSWAMISGLKTGQLGRRLDGRHRMLRGLKSRKGWPAARLSRAAPGHSGLQQRHVNAGGALIHPSRTGWPRRQRGIPKYSRLKRARPSSAAVAVQDSSVKTVPDFIGGCFQPQPGRISRCPMPSRTDQFGSTPSTAWQNALRGDGPASDQGPRSVQG